MQFSEVDALVGYLSGFTRPWCVAGGWGVDLHLNRRTRAHDDIDVMVLDRDIVAFAASMKGVLELFAERPETGERFDWEPSQPLTPGLEALAALTQIGANGKKIQFLVAPTDGDQWVYHRGRGTLRVPLSELALKRDGVSYLTPRVLLLFKSRQMRPKDDADFRALLPSLDPSECQWLLDRITGWQDDHLWIGPLTKQADASA